MTEFNCCTTLTVNTMAGFNITILNFDPNIVHSLQKVSPTLLSKTEVAVLKVSTHSLRKYWAIAQHPLPVYVKEGIVELVILTI